VTAALKAVLQWKYEPTLLNGTPTAVEMEVTVHFNRGS
jgi:outer membrane biosynthesis protein TonB